MLVLEFLGAPGQELGVGRRQGEVTHTPKWGEAGGRDTGTRQKGGGLKFGPRATKKTSPVSPDHGFKLATASSLDK